MPVQPGRSDVHVNRPLTMISLAFMQSSANFVASRVFPTIPVSKQGDSYFTYDRGMFNRDEMAPRAPGTESAGGNYTLSTSTYFATTYAIHRDIPDQVRANADQPINLDREAAEYVALQALIRLEAQWVTDFFAPSIWTTDVTPGNLWSAASSTPIEDVRLGRRTVLQSTGFAPNKLVCARQVYDVLLDHPDIVGRLDRGQTTGPAIAKRDSLAALFELESIEVMDAIENTANEGATNVHAFIGGSNDALLVYAPATPGLMTPSGGYTFAWTGLLGSAATGGRVSRFPMANLKSERVEMEISFDQQLVAADLGYFFEDVVS